MSQGRSPQTRTQKKKTDTDWADPSERGWNNSESARSAHEASATSASGFFKAFKSTACSSRPTTLGEISGDSCGSS